MSALRQSIAAVWVALWVRWRLLALRGRRLFDGEEAAPAGGSGYYLSPAEIPVDGVDYELLELPPELAARLDAVRVELVDQARSATARRMRRRRMRRRRTASLATAALVALAALGAGATALVNGSTGVPAIDRLLGVYEAESEKPGAVDRPGPSGPGLRPAPAGASAPIEVPLDEDARRVVSVAYLAKDGKVCLALAESGRKARRSGELACTTPERIAGQLAKRNVFALTATRYGNEVVVRGFADHRVVRLEGRGPDHRLTVHLGEEWVPGLEAPDRLRPFVAIGPKDDRLAIKGPSSYAFGGTTVDGQAFEFLPE